MPIQRRTKTRPIEDWNSKDLHTFWCGQYNNYRNESYPVHGYLGAELSLLKQLLTQSNVYTVLSTIRVAIKDGATSIQHFYDDFDSLVDTLIEPKIQHYVIERGTPTEISLMRELHQLNSLWFPTTDDSKRRNTVKELLETWISTLQ